MIFVHAITPVSAPRQVGRDAWDPSPHVQRYRAYRDELRARRVHVPEPFHHAIFVLPMPKSWSAKRRLELHGQPHQQKPDRDNLEKALLDACFGEDSHIWDGRTTKLWGERGLLILSAQSIAVTLPFDLTEYYAAVQAQTRNPDRIPAFAPTVPV